MSLGGLFFFFEARHDLDSLLSAFMAFSILVWLLIRGINAVAEIKSHTLPIRHPPERLTAAPPPTRSGSA